jgi:PAS domain S-box-containing protein
VSEHLKALIVEDCESDALLVLRHLAKAGFEVEHLRVMDEGALRAALREGVWDVLISDYSLPGFDAPSALKVVQELAPELPFIVVSGTVGEEIAVGMMKVGAQDYLLKGALSRLGEAVRREMAAARLRRAHRQAEARLEHVNKVLLAIRNINQLIVREKNPGRLIRQATRLLVESRGYLGAWLRWQCASRDTPELAAAGWNGQLAKLLGSEAVRGPSCTLRVGETASGILRVSPSKDCEACPLQRHYAFDAAVCVELRHNQLCHGYLGIALAPGASLDADEESLLLEIAGDLAFALHDIETERRSLQNEAKFRVIAENSPDAIFVADPQGQFTYVNEAAAQLLGFSHATLLGMSVADLAPAGQLERHLAILEEVKAGQKQIVEVELKTTKGAAVPVELNTVLLPSGEIYGSCRDLRGRRRDALRLSKTEARYRRLVERSPDIVWSFSDKRGTLWVSGRVEQVLGISPLELCARPWLWTQSIHPDDQQKVAVAVSNFIAGAELDVEYRIRGADGLWRWLRDRSIGRGVLDGETIIDGISTEITGSKLLELEREQALRETNTLLSATQTVLRQRNLHDAARALFDIGARHIGCKAGFVDLLSEDGSSNTSIVLEAGGEPCTVEGGLPRPIRGLRALAYQSQRAIFDNYFAHSEYAQFLPSGHMTMENVLLAPMVLEGKSLGMWALANKPGGFVERDAQIAEALAEVMAVAMREHRTREALRRSEGMYRELFDASSDALLTIEVEDCSFISFNTSAARLFAITGDAELLGSTLWALAPEQQQDSMPSRERVMLAFEQAMQEGSCSFEMQLHRSSGEDFVASILLSRVEVEGQTLLQATVRDMSEFHAMQGEIAQADRLSSMGMLAAGVAHEINNPLSYVLSNLESLSGDLPTMIGMLRAHFEEFESSRFADVLERFDELYSGVRRIREIARGLATFSRVEPSEIGPCSLESAIDVAINMASNEIKYRARLTKNYGLTPAVMGSEGRLAQVFLNLLINATHAIEEGRVAENEIAIRTWAEADKVFAEVKDTGTGIAPEVLERIFEPFFTTKRIGSGSGLGLAISKNIIQSYGGAITVQSELGVGTTFVIALCRAERLPTETPALLLPAEYAERCGRLLIVDDELGLRRAMARMLCEHETVLASSGAEAIELLSKDTGFDLILCDMMMDDLSGMDVHTWLVEREPELAARLVFVTGGAFTPKAREYMASLSNKFLEKPFESAGLRRFVARCLERRNEERGTRSEE